MLGELTGEGSGKVTGTKVLSADPGATKVEVSIQGTSKLLGVETTHIATYWQTFRAGGVLYGEGELVFMTEKDGPIATWKGFGVGRPTGPGFSARFATCGSFQVTSEELLSLSRVASVSEYTVEENGDYTFKLWEWKPEE